MNYYCFNPSCLKPQNTEGTQFCLNCGSSLQLVERYKAIRFLGGGGFSRTYLAIDQHTPSTFCFVKSVDFHPWTLDKGEI